MKRNPYIAGAPLRKAQNFFGRQKTLEWVVRELANVTTNALVLFGQRRIGKTSFLWKLQQALLANAFLPVYFDLQDWAAQPAGQLLADLADRVSKVAHLDPPGPLAFDDQGRFFRRTFLPQLYKELGERRVVFLLDDFDMLTEVATEELSATTAAKALLPILRRLISDNPWPAFVFIIGKGAEELSKDFSAIFKSALVKELWTLERKSALELIHQAIIDGTLQFTEQAVERILTLTNCHPYLTQLLCWHIWERAYSAKPTTAPLIDMLDIEEAYASALKSGEPALLWWWEGLSSAEKVYAAALAGMATLNVTVPSERMTQVLAAHPVPLRKHLVDSASRALVKRRVLEVTEEEEYRAS